MRTKSRPPWAEPKPRVVGQVDEERTDWKYGEKTEKSSKAGAPFTERQAGLPKSVLHESSITWQARDGGTKRGTQKEPENSTIVRTKDDEAADVEKGSVFGNPEKVFSLRIAIREPWFTWKWFFIWIMTVMVGTVIAADVHERRSRSHSMS